jgi:hypothetical protein
MAASLNVTTVVMQRRSADAASSEVEFSWCRELIDRVEAGDSIAIAGAAMQIFCASAANILIRQHEE